MSGVDYLLLVALNIGIGALIYILLTLRLSNKMYSYGKTHFQEEIRALVLDFYKESESYLVKLESKINQYKNLQQKQSELQSAWSDDDINKLLGLADAINQFGMDNIESALNPTPKKTNRKKATTKKSTGKKKAPATRSRKRNSKSKIIEFERSQMDELPVPALDGIQDTVEIGQTPSALSQTVDTTLNLAGKSIKEPAPQPKPTNQSATESVEPKEGETGAMVRFLAKLGQSVSKTITGSDYDRNETSAEPPTNRFNDMLNESLPKTPEKKSDDELYKLLRENQPAAETRSKILPEANKTPAAKATPNNVSAEVDPGKLGEDLQRLVSQLQGTLNSGPSPDEDKVRISKAAIAPETVAKPAVAPSESEILSGLKEVAGKKDRILYLRDFGFNNERIALELGLNQTEVDLTVRLFAAHQ